MQVLINNQQVDYELENEKKLSDVVESVMRWTAERGLIFMEAIVDNSLYVVEEIPDLDVQDVEVLNCLVESRSDMVFSTAGEGVAYCERVLSYIDEIPDGEEITAENLQEVMEGVNWLTEVFYSVAHLLEINPEGFRFKDKPVLQFIDELRKTAIEIDQRPESVSPQEFIVSKKNIFEDARDVFRMILVSDEMKTLIIQSIDSPDVLMTSLQQIKTELPEMINRIEEIAIAFQTGKDEEAGEKLNEFIEFVYGYTRTCYQIAPVFNLMLSDIMIEDTSLEEMNNELLDLLNETMEILENNDIISLSDIMEYEFKPAFEEIEGFIALLIDRIND